MPPQAVTLLEEDGCPYPAPEASSKRKLPRGLEQFFYGIVLTPTLNLELR